MEDDHLHDWLDHLDPTGKLSHIAAADNPEEPARRTLPFAKLAVLQTISLAAILAAAVVAALAIALRPGAPAVPAQATTTSSPAAPNAQTAVPSPPLLTPRPAPVKAPGADDFVKWRYNTGAGELHDIVNLHDQLVVCASSNDTVYAVGPDGKLAWTYRWPGSHLEGLVHDQQFYMAWGSGSLVYLGPDGKAANELKAGGFFTAVPVMANNKVVWAYSKDNRRPRPSTLVAKYPWDKAELMRWESPDEIRAIMAYDDMLEDEPGAVVVVQHGAGMQLVSLKGGRELWRKDLGDVVPLSPVKGRGMAFAIARHAGRPHLLAFNMHTGEEYWWAKLPTDPTLLSGTWSEGHIYVQCGEMLLAFDSNGKEAWRFGSNSSPVQMFDVDLDGYVQVATPTEVRGFLPDGAVLWKLPLGKDAQNFNKRSMAQGKKGAYVGLNGELVYVEAPGQGKAGVY